LSHYSQCGCYYTSTNGYTYLSGSVDTSQGHLEMNRDLARHSNEGIIRNYAPIIQVWLLWKYSFDLNIEPSYLYILIGQVDTSSIASIMSNAIDLHADNVLQTTDKINSKIQDYDHIQVPIIISQNGGHWIGVSLCLLSFVFRTWTQIDTLNQVCKTIPIKSKLIIILIHLCLYKLTVSDDQCLVFFAYTLFTTYWAGDHTFDGLSTNYYNEAFNQSLINGNFLHLPSNTGNENQI